MGESGLVAADEKLSIADLDSGGEALNEQIERSFFGNVHVVLCVLCEVDGKLTSHWAPTTCGFDDEGDEVKAHAIRGSLVLGALPSLGVFGYTEGSSRVGADVGGSEWASDGDIDKNAARAHDESDVRQACISWAERVGWFDGGIGSEHLGHMSQLLLRCVVSESDEVLTISTVKRMKGILREIGIGIAAETIDIRCVERRQTESETIGNNKVWIGHVRDVFVRDGDHPRVAVWGSIRHD